MSALVEFHTLRGAAVVLTEDGVGTLNAALFAVQRCAELLNKREANGDASGVDSAQALGLIAAIHCCAELASTYACGGPEGTLRLKDGRAEAVVSEAWKQFAEAARTQQGGAA